MASVVEVCSVSEMDRVGRDGKVDNEEKQVVVSGKKPGVNKLGR